MGHEKQDNRTWVTKGPEIQRVLFYIKIPKMSSVSCGLTRPIAWETWGSLLRTMNTYCIVAVMLDFFDVCHPALKMLLPNSFTLIACVI